MSTSICTAANVTTLKPTAKRAGGGGGVASAACAGSKATLAIINDPEGVLFPS